MSRMVFCILPQREAEGQDFQLYPGNLGKCIYNEIPKKAWVQWQHRQTMPINEGRLSMMNVKRRKLLEQEMINFLSEGKDVHTEGYAPESQESSPDGAALVRPTSQPGPCKRQTQHAFLE